MRRTLLLAASILAVSATSAVAQGRGRNTNGVPPGQRPPAGMCRVWIDGVPPGHQPAVTDCTTAQLNVPVNGRIIYGSGVLPSGNIFTRSRQLADGSWVLDRYRLGANGQTYLISTTPSRNRASAGRRVRGDEQGEDNERGKKVKKAKTHGHDGEVENDNDNDHEHDNRSVLGTVVPRGVEMDDHGRGNENHGNGKGKGKH
jgi:hypothetical protein